MTERAREAARNAVMQGQLSRQVNAYEIDAAIDTYIAALGETHAIVPRATLAKLVEHTQEALSSELDHCIRPEIETRIQSDLAWLESVRAMLNAAEQQRTEQA